MKLKNIISESKFTDKEKVIGQIIRLAVLDGRFPVPQQGDYTGKNSIGIYQLNYDYKTKDIKMDGGFSVPTDSSELDEKYVLWAYDHIAGDLKLSVSDYAEAGGDLVALGDAIAEKMYDAKFKKGDKAGQYPFVHKSSGVRQNSFLSNPVAQTAGLKRELVDAIDSQIIDDLGKAQEEIDIRVSQKGE